MRYTFSQVKKYFLLAVLFFFGPALSSIAGERGYIIQDTPSSPKTTYYIDPANGNDLYSGKQRNKPWKTFRKINQLILAPGDRVEIISAGTFHESLHLRARGQLNAPVIIQFTKGRYDFFPDSAVKKQLFISNTNDDPAGLKSIAILLDSCSFVNLLGANSLMVMRGKMIETCIMNSNNIRVEGLSYDYERPTVSEAIVVDSGSGYADLLIHKDSNYSITDSLLIWEGEGWKVSPGYLWQKLNIKRNEVQRIEMPVVQFRYVEKKKGQVRVYFPVTLKQEMFIKGMVYQNRDITRDCAGIFMERSRNIYWKNIRLYFMHGMGVVSQFCENVRIDSMLVKPAISSGRTCSAWADILHFSGCKGTIEISNSYLSAANDDAINIHGTHLQIVELINAEQVRVRFMHPQTFGFKAFVSGDTIDFVRATTLISYGSNVVKEVKQLNDKEFLLTLLDPLPTKSIPGDVIENVSWTPEVRIHHNTIARIPTRGILLTTRRKSLIEFNTIQKTFMHGILVSDDAMYWYESGMVRNLIIQHNIFNHCGEPAIAVIPDILETDSAAVHSGIKILHNRFYLKGNGMFTAWSVAGIQLTNNSIYLQTPGHKPDDLISLKSCTNVLVKDNKIIPPAQ